MSRRGMTLIEMMVAMTATLLLMGAIAQVFSAFGSAVSDSRSIIDMDARMRSVVWRLRTDLAGATAPTLPPLRPEADAGYFEIIEGPSSDTRHFYDEWTDTALGPSAALDQTRTPLETDAVSDDRILGDTDDVLLFTTRCTNPPFLGRFTTPMPSGVIQVGKYESPVAEVAWFLRPTRTGTSPSGINPATYTLHRRQLLVVGYVGAEPFASARNMVDTTMLSGTWSTLDRFYSDFDLSVRLAAGTTGTTYIPNTLADLTRRESRFLHNLSGITSGTGVPFKFPWNYQSVVQPTALTFAGSSREGDDVVLTNVVAFDVRVFDPAAAVKVSGDAILVPGDPGFTSGTTIAQGAFVDLGNADTTTGPSGLPPRFSSQGDTRSSLNAFPTPPARTARTWDAWSTHYESDGVDQDGAYGVDQGSNGFDDNGDGFVDNGDWDANRDGIIQSTEWGEQEMSPPYPSPLRGVEVRLRCYDPSSRQVRQITIRHTFVPH